MRTPLMIERALAFALIAVPIAAHAQGLVLNPSFEWYTDCTYGPSYWFMEAWHIVECTEYAALHACSDSTHADTDVPSNYFGHEAAHTGDGYVGLTAFDLFYEAKSFVCIQLPAPLEAGVDYCCHFWLSLADKSRYTVDSMQVAFTAMQPDACVSADTTIWIYPQGVQFDISAVDSAGWFPIEGAFTAIGTERWLIIGNAEYGADVDTSYFADQMPFHYSSVYYLDDVYLDRCDVGFAEPATGEVMRISPNPVEQGCSAELRFDEPVSVEHDINVLDVLGRTALFLNAQAGTDHLELPTNELRRGLYLITAAGMPQGALRLMVE